MRIAALIPAAGQADDLGLREVDADALARYVIDASHPWWRRRPCALALRDRVPPAQLDGLLARVRDGGDVSEVRVALLDVLGDRAELLPWLAAQTGEQPYKLAEAVLKARAAQGDLTAAPAIATLANHPSSGRRAIGEAALEALVARHGEGVVARAIGDARPEDRVFQIRMRSRRGDDVIGGFADPDVDVARTACEHVVATGVPDDEMLLDHVVTGPTTEARLWAAYALHLRGRDVRELWHAIDRPRVEIAGLDDDLRLAILREYPGAPRTDPRWLVERACVDLPPAPDEAAQLARAVAALDAAGFAPRAPKSIGEVYDQGGGTFHVIELGDGREAISVSTLGPYASGEDAARAALERAGFRWIDAALGTTVVAGLCVYYFGRRAPLDVRTLVFYWQD